MQTIAVLALFLGIVQLPLLDGQVFSHAVIGIVCGVTAISCGLASSRKEPRFRWEGWIIAGGGVALAVFCIVLIPGAYQEQKRFNRGTLMPRERTERPSDTTNRTPSPRP